MANDTSLESSYALLLESSKNCKFAKVDFFAKYGYKVRSKKWSNKDFWKAALEHDILNMQKKFTQFSKAWCVNDMRHEVTKS